jgi:hypothetical protein
MMTATEFASLLKDSSKRESLAAVDWGPMLTEYPYASSLFVFRVMAESPQNPDFEEFIHQAAARTVSRSRLMFLMEGVPELQFFWDEADAEEAGLPEAETVDFPELTEKEGVENVHVAAMKPPVEFGFSFVRIKAGAKKQPLPAMQEIPAGKARQVKTRQQDLIDKFIREEPAMQQPGLDFGDSPRLPDLARNSGKLKEEIVSESMAMILIRQKKFEKAIATLHKLSLKFPEKSDYFAALIKNLENQKTK